MIWVALVVSCLAGWLLGLLVALAIQACQRRRQAERQRREIALRQLAYHGIGTAEDP